MSALLPKRQFRDAIRAFVPSWLSDQGPGTLSFGFKLLYSVAAVLDGMTEAMVQGMQADMPGIGTPTALGYLCRDRRIIRGREESDTAIALRLKGWLDAWRRAGHPFEILRQLRGYFGNAIKARTVDNSGNWYTITEDGTELRHHIPGSWDWDGNSIAWARLWVIIYAPSTWTTWTDFFELDPDLYGGDLAGAPYTIGHKLPVNQAVVADVREIVRRWKPVHAFVPTIIISQDPALFDPEASGTWPTGSWGAFTTGNPPELARPQGARYWKGVE